MEINNHIIFDALHLSIIFFYEAQQTHLSSSHTFNIILHTINRLKKNTSNPIFIHTPRTFMRQVKYPVKLPSICILFVLFCEVSGNLKRLFIRAMR